MRRPTFVLLLRGVFRANGVVAICLVAACAPVTRRGLEPLVTDRPDYTESTETVESGMRQLESGSTYSRTLDEKSTAFGEVLLRVGVTARAELRVGLNSYSLIKSAGTTARGFEDISLGMKYKLMDAGGVGTAKPALALILASTLPTGSASFRATQLQPEVKFGAAWDLTPRVAFSSNLNYALVRETTGNYGEVSASGSFGFGLTDRVGTYVEYFTFVPQTERLASTHFLNGGVTYGITPNLQLDARFGVGLKKLGGPDYFVGAGFARRW